MSQQHNYRTIRPTQSNTGQKGKQNMSLHRQQNKIQRRSCYMLLTLHLKTFLRCNLCRSPHRLLHMCPQRKYRTNRL